jgi:HAE1 family hydrophobic/amphiphilic exporter-1
VSGAEPEDEGALRGLRDAIPSLAVHRPVGVIVLFLALLVLGAIAYARIPVQMLPDGFEPKVLWVRIPLSDASPQEVDDLIIRPVTEQLGSLHGLKSMRTTAGESAARVVLEFHPSMSMAEAYNSTVDRLERALPDLPDEVERYWVFKFNPSDEPILWAGVTFGEEVDDPATLMDKVVVPRLERIPGVASVDLWGVNRRAIAIDWDRDKLVSMGVDIGGAQAALGGDNFQMSAGRLEERGQVWQLRSLSPLHGVDDLRAYPIERGRLRLADVGAVGMRQLSDGAIDRVNGREAAAFGVRKESVANTVETAAAVAAALDELAADPRTKGSEFLTFFSQGELIEDSTTQLQESLLEGAALSVLILLVFLRDWRMTILISAGIPFCLLMTVAAMWATGSSMNLIAIMGLILAMGNVIDNAIVVVEAIYQRRARGESVDVAAVRGAGEVNLAILASTLTGIVVFLPVILMSEDAEVAFFMGELGMPVVYAMTASLLVALVFAPLATRFVRSGAIRPDPAWLVWLADRYAGLLDAMLRRRADTGVSVFVLALLTVGVAVPGVDCSGGGEGGFNSFNVELTVPPDATVPERDAIARRFEGLLEAHREDWGIKVYRLDLPASGSSGDIQVYLEDDGPLPLDEVTELAKAALPTEIPGVRAEIGWGEGEGDDRQLSLRLFGEDMTVLEGLAEEVARRARAVPGVLTAAVALEESGVEELRVRPDHDQLERYGVSARSVAQTLAFAMRGNSALPALRVGDQEVDVVSRVAVEDRRDIATLLDFPVFSAATGRTVPIRALARTEIGRGPGSIVRDDRRTSVEVQVDLAVGQEASEVGPAVKAATADMALPRGYSVDADTWRRDQDEQDTATWFALGMSVVFVYLLMGVLFESWLYPLGILVSIPMAMLGAFWGLYLTDTPMDMMAGIGLVVLVGIVVSNGIVLVDRILQAREEGLSREAAVLDACRTRLRPILMTALTTILGVIPMAAGTQDFIGIPYAPLGRCIMGGMVASTVLTMGLVPVLYILLDDLAAWWQGYVAWLRS